VQNVAPKIATVSTAKLYIQPPAEAIKLAEAKPVAVAVEEPVLQKGSCYKRSKEIIASKPES
jgi:hypothetical protein